MKKTPIHIIIIIMLFASCQSNYPKEQSHIIEKSVNPSPMDKTLMPEPVFDTEPEFVEFYWKAWELAWNHVKESKGAPQSPYMDEAHWTSTIWIWDTSFMMHYCKYAPELFPGIESLDNFYAIMHDKQTSSLFIQHPDNPPLFAWSEYEYFKLTGDTTRLRKVLIERQYLQKHYYLFDNFEPDTKYPYAGAPVKIKKHPNGYQWGGVQSGMDNTPRGRGDEDSILWIDAIAQQALSAYYIKEIASVLKQNDIVQEYSNKYKKQKELINRYYWNSEDGIYYDIKVNSPYEHVAVKTPAAYWPMLALTPGVNQAELLAGHIENKKVFGGVFPLPSVSRDDKDFESKGKYWRGGIWLPTAYMSIKALEKYGYFELADKTSYNLIKQMLKTYKEVEPHTIWECYSPTEAKPSTMKKNEKYSRQDFCGWSALGPISLFIENVLGFHEIDATEKRVVWRKYQKGRHGIKGLRFGTVVTDIISEGDKIMIVSNEPYTLVVNTKEYVVKNGKTILQWIE
ncbi:MAG: trehalase family glycosidase [Bacteroidota bacterium]